MENQENIENIEIIDDGDITEKAAAAFVENLEKAAASAPVENIGEDAILSGQLSPEQFEQHFFELFDIVGDLWDMPDFKIHNDRPFEVAGAKVSAKKLYIMAQKYKMLHFLIEPCGGWFGDMIAISCFAGAKANIVCKKYTGNGLTGYFKRFLKKSGEQIQKKTSFLSKIFGKGGDNEKENKNNRN